MSDKELCFFVPSDRPGFPWYGINDMMQAIRVTGRRPNRQKEAAEKWVSAHAYDAMIAQGWVAPEGTCTVTLTFVEMGRNRDPDNIFGGAKYILDALCEPLFHHRDKKGREIWRHKNGCGALKDDSQKYVELHCAIAERTDKEAPGVWVRIREMGETDE